MLKQFLENLLSLLRQTGVFINFPLTVLLFGLEELIEFNFSCPCSDKLNVNLTVSIFIGPALLIFALMFLFLRPFQHGWFCCFSGANDDTQQSWPKALISCLILPVMWIFILFLDGDYFACAMTDWKGVYEFDNELNRSWCKPTEGMRNETELRDLTNKYIHQSQFTAFVMIGVFGGVLVTTVGIFDCCNSKKCDRCPKKLSKLFKSKETDKDTQKEEDIPLSHSPPTDQPPSD